MTEDPAAKTSLAQRLADDRYRDFAKMMSGWPPPPFTSPATMEAVIAGFKRQSFETAIGKDSVPLQEATYFARTAKGMTKLSQVMSDKVLVDVVTTALGIPQEFKALNYDQQVAILKPRLDMKQFATEGGVAKFIDKYLALEQLNKGASGGPSNPVVGLFSGGNAPGLTLDAKSLAPRALNLFA